ncbi:MAG: DUF3883 domain-containing protein [Janthinobacterium lividum]
MSSSEAVISEFRMSAFVALMALRRYIRDHPETSAEEAAKSLKRSDADLAAADFDCGLRLHTQIPPEIDFVQPTESLRRGLSILISTHRPWWCRFFPFGRQRLATALTQDEVQTFRSAGLFEEYPSKNIVEWWDGLASMMRSLENQRLNEQGREAEQLSLAHERSRLISLGIQEQPRWTALDDNGAGYDIQSYEKTEFGRKNLLIEVKSTKRSPPQMILTRGEWDAAMKYGQAYVFHLWQLPCKKLTVLTVEDVAKHVPSDNGAGRWTELEIHL